MSTDQPCPHPTFDYLNILWRNYSLEVWNGDKRKYASYVCRYATYYEQRSLSDTVEGHLVLLFSGFGFLGGLLTVLTLTQVGFRVLNFRLFLLIGYLEMLQMTVLALMDGLAYARCESSYLCTFLWAHVGITIMNICADAIDLLVLFLCVERTVACLVPHQFQRIHNDRCYNTAAAFAIVLPAAFSLFQAFELTVTFDADSGRYLDEPSEFSQSDFYFYLKQVNTVRFYATAALVAFTTGLSIWGFCAVAKRRRKLSSNRKSHSVDISSAEHSCTSATRQNHLYTNPTNRYQRQNARKTKNRQAELCCLQLCLAVPVVINHVLYATGSASNSAFQIGETALKKATHEMSFESAVGEIERAESFQYLRAATNVSNVMAHALHFYLYVVFSLKVRQGFCNLLRRMCRLKKKRSASPSLAVEGSPITQSRVFTNC